ncbi:hypothetical protein OROGR_016195 [Orobanche gracilis]
MPITNGNGYAVHDLNGAKAAHKKVLENQTKELFLIFHCFCTRKDIHCLDVVLEDTDIAKAIAEYVARAAIENLVLGASRHGFIKRLKTADVPTSVSKEHQISAPCMLYLRRRSLLSGTLLDWLHSCHLS